MRSRATARLAYALALLALLVDAAGVCLLVHTRHVGPTDTTASVPSDALGAVSVVPFVVIGTLVAVRRSRNPTGWVFLGLGLLSALGLVLERYPIYTLLVNPDWGPGGRVAASLQANAYLPFLIVLLFLVLLFPNGRLAGTRWRRLAPLGAAAFVACYAVVSMKAGALGRPFDAFENPLGVDALSGLTGLLTALLLAPGFLILLAAVVSAVARFRRSRGVERQQFKWFSLGAATIAVGLIAHAIADAIAPGAIDVIEFLVSLAVAGLPIAAGIAILRYRLYEIDRIVNRTLVYGLLSALLAGLYFGIVVGLEAAFGSFTQGNELAVAGSTLAVAALFRPARRKIQATVDRRFYRSKVDAERTLAAFSARLRQEIDLGSLTGELSAAVQETMQPAHLSLWLRAEEAHR